MSKPGRGAWRRRAVGLGVAAGLGALALFWVAASGEPLPEPKPGLPLLQPKDTLFHDAQVGLKLTPPARWSMQARTTRAPGVELPERMLVKYKKLIGKQPAAWLRVYVVASPPAESLEDALRGRSPGVGWRPVRDMDELAVNGRPARRRTFAGTYEGQESVREITAVRRGGELFFFIATYRAKDPTAGEQARQAVASAVWDESAGG